MTLKCCRGNFPILPGRLVPGDRVVCPPLIKSPGEDNEGGEGHSVPVSRAVNEQRSVTLPGEVKRLLMLSQYYDKWVPKDCK